MATHGKKAAKVGRRRSLKVAGIFAGVGGLELGLSRAGHVTKLLVENDRAARAVLGERFEGVRLHGNVTTLSRLPARTELLAAGFPCQDLSQVGQLAGLKGEKSSLVFEILRLLRRRRVPWVLLENVPFMLYASRGRALRLITGELEDLGYHWAYRTIDSRAFGLPQRRERVFILASLENDPRDVLLAEDAASVSFPRRATGVACGFYWTEGNRGLGWAVDCVPPLKGGSGIGIPSAPGILLPDGSLITPDIRDAERLQGFPSRWTLPATKVGERHRWRLVGNAVSVPVAEWIGRRLGKPGEYDPEGDERLRRGDTLPRAAWCMGEGVHRSGASAWPARRQPRALLDFLLHSGKPLSLKAAVGLQKRLRASSLHVPRERESALRNHIDRLSREDAKARLAA